MPKASLKKYRVVTSLPEVVYSVSEYAKSEGVTTSYLYKLLREGNAKYFEIVLFHGYCFVIPK